jgi:hypothetical protein
LFLSRFDALDGLSAIGLLCVIVGLWYFCPPLLALLGVLLIGLALLLGCRNGRASKTDGVGSPTAESGDARERHVRLEQ